MKSAVYEIPPLPDEYLKITGDRTLSVTLAFDPPTRPTRGDSYLGVVMEFDLFKNLDKEDIVSVFIKKVKKETLTEEFTQISKDELKKKYGSGVCVDLFPGANLRKKGSLQRGQISISSKAVGYTEKPLYLVVTCSRKWAKQGEIDMQRYALVVSINHSNPEVDLYNKLRLRTQIAQRIRIR